MIAFITLGKKTNGKMYGQEDMAVFFILASQSALAIENAQFFEDMKTAQEQLFEAEKMATIGTMADGLSHQINNRLHAMSFIAGDALDSIGLKKNASMSKQTQELLKHVEFALERLKANVSKGGEVVGSLLKYTRHGAEGFAAVELDKLLDATFEMIQFKVRLGGIKVLKRFSKDVPKINGNFTQLQEVFFNIIDNAYDAMMQRKSEKEEVDYVPQLEINAAPLADHNRQNSSLEIIVKDNGIGIKPENKNKLFTPFFTTKITSKKGTGLGLYVIRQIIEKNHGGKVYFESEYGKGTRIHVILPAAK